MRKHGRTAHRARTVLGCAVVAAGTVIGSFASVALTRGGAAAAPKPATSGSTHAALAQPVVGGAASHTGNGWWEVASDGGIFSYGDAPFLGSTGGIHLNSPIVGMATTQSGGGYWLVAADGGIFSFGDAVFYGSTGAIHLNSPIVGMAVAHGGGGYWMVAADGGVFAFAEAPFAGSAAGQFGSRAVGIVPSPSGGGYWISAANGEVASFGDAPSVVNAVGAVPSSFVNMVPQAGGLRLIGTDTSSVAIGANGISVSVAAAAPMATSSSFSWMTTNDDGSPVRYNPCAPVHYVTNVAEAPAGAAALVAGAFARITAATGITFISDGNTSEVPSSQRSPRDANGWAPIIVAWARPSETDLLPGGSTIGEGGSWWVQSGSSKVYVTGAVAIDPDNTRSLAASFGSGTSVGELLLHELGHVMGLGHTQDKSQIMYPDILPLQSASYAAGDVTGLHQLGVQAGCITEPTP